MHLTISGDKAPPQQQVFAELQWSHVLCQSPEGSVPAAAANKGMLRGARCSIDTAPMPPTASSQTQLGPPLPVSPFALLPCQKLLVWVQPSSYLQIWKVEYCQHR